MHIALPTDLFRLPVGARVTLHGDLDLQLERTHRDLSVLPSPEGEMVYGLLVSDKGEVLEGGVTRFLTPNREFVVAGPQVHPLVSHPQTFSLDGLTVDKQLDLGTQPAGSAVTIKLYDSPDVTLCTTTMAVVNDTSIEGVMAHNPAKLSTPPVTWMQPRVLVPGVQLSIGGSPAGFIKSFEV